MTLIFFSKAADKKKVELKEILFSLSTYTYQDPTKSKRRPKSAGEKCRRSSSRKLETSTEKNKPFSLGQPR